MKLPNWFKIFWWVLLTGTLTWYLANRYHDLVSGRAVPADIVVFVIWVALLLAPVFAEVSLLGITLKKEMDELQTFVSNQIGDLKNEVKNAVDIRTTFSPQINFPAPPPDAQLPEIENRITAAVSEAFAQRGLVRSTTSPTVDIADDVAFLFSIRYGIESELRRISTVRELTQEGRRPVPPFRVVNSLIDVGLLEPRLANAIREVYSVCSPAIHGEPVSQAQVAFVRDVGPQLIDALRAIV